MAERKRQYSIYTDETLGDKIEDAADEHDMSIAELLREGSRRQLQQLSGERGRLDGAEPKTVPETAERENNEAVFDNE